MIVTKEARQAAAIALLSNTGNPDAARAATALLNGYVERHTVKAVVELIEGKATAEPQADEIMTPEEVAKMLRCTTRTVLNYAKLGKISRIGKRSEGTQTRYSRRSVIAFMEGAAA